MCNLLCLSHSEYFEAFCDLFGWWMHWKKSEGTSVCSLWASAKEQSLPSRPAAVERIYLHWIEVWFWMPYKWHRHSACSSVQLSRWDACHAQPSSALCWSEVLSLAHSVKAARPYMPNRHAVTILLLETFLDMYAVTLRNIFHYLLFKCSAVYIFNCIEKII